MPVRIIRHRERSTNIARALHVELVSHGLAVTPWPDLTGDERENLISAIDSVIEQGLIDCKLCPPFEEW